MATSETTSTWERIQNGVNETERLIGQKKYNLAMLKARTTLEFMVKRMADKACIVDGDLVDVIDDLYQGHWIDKTTCEHYHKIRMIGNKAAHEDYDNAYDANQAYHMLSQEVYTFANSSGSRKGAVKGNSRSAASQRTSGAAKQSAPNVDVSMRSRRQASSRRSFSPYNLLKLLIPVLCIILLIVVIKFIKPSKDDKLTSSSEVTTEQAEETTAPVTEEETTASAAFYITTTTLNVRNAPSTDGERIGQLPEGMQVEYIEAYDDDWAKIKYYDQEAYVSSQYIKPVE